MSDKNEEIAARKAALAERPEKREFLSLMARDAEGNMLFSKLGLVVPFKVASWEWFSKEGQDRQIALVVSEPSGKEYLFPLGKTNQYVVSDAGIKDPDDLINGTVHIETYETGSAGGFAVGKRISRITLAKPAKE